MDRHQKKQARRQVRKEKRIKQQGVYNAKQLPKFSLCIAAYCDEHENFKRVTGVLTKLDYLNHDDKTLERKEIWLDALGKKTENMLQEERFELNKQDKQEVSDLMEKEASTINDWILEVTQKHHIENKDLFLSSLSAPVPLEKCGACECGAYNDRFISSKDIIRLLKAG